MTRTARSSRKKKSGNKIKSLTEKIKAFAIADAGFDLVGVSLVELPPHHAEALASWVGEGRAAGMEYMKREPARRADATQSLPGARSVLSLALNYFHPEDPKPSDAVGKIAKYAYGRDYHTVIEKKLKRLAAYIKEAGGPDTEVRSYVDTGPILEKAYAREAGLGFFGKNTNIITREYGSFVFLASLVTTLALEPDRPHTGACGSCRICIDACPTGALSADYKLDSGKCISYWTIESKEPIPADIRERQSGWVFGCDICQDVCPYNVKAKTTRHAEIYPEKRAGSWLTEAQLADPGAFAGSPVKRSKSIRAMVK